MQCDNKDDPPTSSLSEIKTDTREQENDNDKDLEKGKVEKPPFEEDEQQSCDQKNVIEHQTNSNGLKEGQKSEAKLDMNNVPSGNINVQGNEQKQVEADSKIPNSQKGEKKEEDISDISETDCKENKMEDFTNCQQREVKGEKMGELTELPETKNKEEEKPNILETETKEDEVNISGTLTIGEKAVEVTNITEIQIKEVDGNAGSLENDMVLDKFDKEDEKQFEIPPVEAFLPFSKFVDIRSIESFDAIQCTSVAHHMVRDSALVNYLKHKDTKKVKTVLRNSSWSANHPIRDSLWTHICRFLHKAEGSVFEEFEKDLFSERRNIDISLPSFVDFDNLTSYHLSEEGLKTVSKIMVILHHTNPDITYSPTLFETVCLFLHYMGPSDTYNCVYGLLRAKDNNYIVQTKVALEASKLVIRDLTKKFAKSAYVYLVRNSSNIDIVFDSWMWWIFSDLPFPHLVRIFDCYLLEGVKVLYRVILAILIIYTKYSVKRPAITITHESSNGSLVSSIRQFCKDIPVTVEKLLKTGFAIRGFTRKEIRKLQVKNEMYVNSRHLLNHDVPKSHSSNSALSRTFSGPMSLQHVDSSIFSNDMEDSVLTSCESSIDMLYKIWSWLPPRYAVCQPELLYTSEEHGCTLMTLYTRTENHEPTLIVIKTTTDEVFGAFCSTYWRDRRHRTKNLSYFGTGETFIFTLAPEKHKYEWVGLHQSDVPNTANMFLAGDNSVLTIGGGHGEAIQLDANLLHCRTEKCDTFDNDPLCSEQDFTCKVVEVYGFH